jgi:hypothetical protein
LAEAIVFKIFDGQLGLKVVDRQEVGYLDSWRAPGGKTVDTVTLADYDTGSATFMCQVTSAQITSSPDTTTEDVEATMCAPAKTIPTPGESTFAIDIGALADMNVAAGLQRFAFEHDAEECYLYVGFNGTDPPRAIGRVMMASLPIGGDMRAKMLGTVTWPFTGKPQIEFGDATTSAVVPPSTTTMEAAAAVSEPEPQPAGV